MNPLRSVVAVIAGAALISFIDRTLEQILVRAIAEVPPVSEATYLGVRNRPAVLIATLITHALAATLSGYIVAKIAGTYEMRHAIAAAVVLTVGYAFAFMSDNVMLPPLWVRVAMLIVTAPALLAGASIRAQARSIQEEAADMRPEERS